MPRVIWTGDASSAERAQENLTAKEKAYNKALQEGVKFAAELERQAKKLADVGKTQEKYNVTMRQFGDEVSKNTGRLEQAATSGAKAFGSQAAANLQHYLTGLVTVGGAISLIRTTLADIVALDERASQRARDAAPPDAALRRVIATDPKRQTILDTVDRIAQQESLSIDDVKRAATAAYGATSNAELTNQALEEAYKVTRDPLVAAETARGIGFVLQSSGIRDPTEARGFLDQVLALSPIEDAKVPQQLAKVVGSFTSPTAGGSAATAAALLSLGSQLSGDTEGERTRTGVIELEDQLDAFFDKNRRKFKLAKEASDGIDEQLEFLFRVGNEGAASQFVAETKFASPVAGGFSRLFQDEAARRQFRDALPQLGSREARLKAARETAEFTLAGDVQDATRGGNVITSEAEKLDLEKARRGVFTSDEREKFITTIAEAVGGTVVGARVATFAATGPTLDRAEAIEFGGSIVNDPNNRGLDNPGMRALREMVDGLKKIESNQKSKNRTRSE